LPRDSGFGRKKDEQESRRGLRLRLPPATGGTSLTKGEISRNQKGSAEDRFDSERIGKRRKKREEEGIPISPRFWEVKAHLRNKSG